MVTGLGPVRLVVVAAVLVVAGYGLASSAVATVRQLVQLGKAAVADSKLAAESKQATPVYALGALYPEIEFLRQQLPAGSHYRLVLPPEDMAVPVTRVSTRHAVLYYLYPSVAVDDPAGVSILIGVDGADLVAAGAQPGSIIGRGKVMLGMAAAP
jgi:hypothetical protein